MVWGFGGNQITLAKVQTPESGLEMAPKPCSGRIIGEGKVPLQEAYPDFMMLSSDPKVTIFERWSNQGWNLNFRRHLNDWEVE